MSLMTVSHKYPPCLWRLSLKSRGGWHEAAANWNMSHCFTVSSFYSGCCHPAAAEQPSEPRGPWPRVAPCHGGGAWKPVIIWRYLQQWPQYLRQYLHGAVRSCAAPRLPWSAAAARLAAAGAGPRLAMCPQYAARWRGGQLTRDHHLAQLFARTHFPDQFNFVYYLVML